MDREQAAKEVGARIWGCPVDEVFPEDLSVRFPWAKRFAIVMLMDLQRHTMLIAVDDQGSDIAFNVPFRGEDALSSASARLGDLNTLFDLEAVRLPDAVPPVDLAYSIRGLLAGVPGVVGSKAHWDRLVDNLWRSTVYRPRNPDDFFANAEADLLKKYCAEPKLAKSGERWTLSFYFFNVDGAVEHWEVRGDGRAVTDTQLTMAESEGRFIYPFV